MSTASNVIGFVRRGYSASGGAEAYLKRLADGIVRRGYQAVLFTTDDWPESEWNFGPIVRVKGNSPMRFADELEKLRERSPVDVLLSLERVRSCDIYRAGDGVHRAWLERRAKLETPWQKFLRRFNTKHQDTMRLEELLFNERRAERVIANSQMVKNEIIDFYNYRSDRIDIVRNGISLEDYRFDQALREKARAQLELLPDEIGLLFVGTGWERKGLRFAITAAATTKARKVRLLVAGRGRREGLPPNQARFLGEVSDLRPIYAAADIFILPTIYDPFSNACLEALAAGLPVITTRANGFSEIMEDKIHGSIVDRGNDVRSLGNAIELWADPTWRSAARPSILKRAAKYDIARSVEQTVAVVAQVAATASSTVGKMRNT
jgi:UDP-glucose:(heptosyl)LPS alpha-1,3-glucosyltransferase